MTRAEFLNELEELLEQAPGTLQGPERLEDIGWDSLGFISFIAMVDEKLGMVAAPAAIAKCKTADDLIALVGDKILAAV